MKKTLFFDFDGVVLHSVNIKTEAFRDMYLPYGEDIANKVVDYHIEHGGVSRFEKFKYYHKEFLGEEIDQAMVDQLASQFSSIVFGKILKCSFIDGVKTFLEGCVNEYNLYIVSGTPEVELKEIVKARGLDSIFDEKNVFGSPKNKIELLQSIKERDQFVDYSQSYFFGDASTDMKAAKHYDIPFVLVKNEDNINLVDKSDVVISDFVGFKL